MIAILFADKTAAFVDLLSHTVKRFPGESDIIAIAWSPRGEQLVCSRHSAFLDLCNVNCFLESPSSSFTNLKDINFTTVREVKKIVWVTCDLLLVFYHGKNESTIQTAYIVRKTSNWDLEFTEIPDVVSSGAGSSARLYIATIRDFGEEIPNMAIIANSSDFEIIAIGQEKDGKWQRWDNDEAMTISLPLSHDMQANTYPIGMAIDFSSTNGPEGSSTPMPVLYWLSNEGRIGAYYCCQRNMIERGEKYVGMVEAVNPKTALPVSKAEQTSNTVQPLREAESSGILSAAQPAANDASSDHVKVASFATLNFSLPVKSETTIMPSLSSTPDTPSNKSISGNVEWEITAKPPAISGTAKTISTLGDNNKQKQSAVTAAPLPSNTGSLSDKTKPANQAVATQAGSSKPDKSPFTSFNKDANAQVKETTEKMEPEGRDVSSLLSSGVSSKPAESSEKQTLDLDVLTSPSSQTRQSVTTANIAMYDPLSTQRSCENTVKENDNTKAQVSTAETCFASAAKELPSVSTFSSTSKATEGFEAKTTSVSYPAKNAANLTSTSTSSGISGQTVSSKPTATPVKTIDPSQTMFSTLQPTRVQHPPASVFGRTQTPFSTLSSSPSTTARSFTSILGQTGTKPASTSTSTIPQGQTTLASLPAITPIPISVSSTPGQTSFATVPPVNSSARLASTTAQGKQTLQSFISLSTSNATHGQKSTTTTTATTPAITSLPTLSAGNTIPSPLSLPPRIGTSSSTITQGQTSATISLLQPTVKPPWGVTLGQTTPAAKLTTSPSSLTITGQSTILPLSSVNANIPASSTYIPGGNTISSYSSAKLTAAPLSSVFQGQTSFASPTSAVSAAIPALKVSPEQSTLSTLPSTDSPVAPSTIPASRPISNSSFTKPIKAPASITLQGQASYAAVATTVSTASGTISQNQNVVSAYTFATPTSTPGSTMPLGGAASTVVPQTVPTVAPSSAIVQGRPPFAMPFIFPLKSSTGGSINTISNPIQQKDAELVSSEKEEEKSRKVEKIAELMESVYAEVNQALDELEITGQELTKLLQEQETLSCNDILECANAQKLGNIEELMHYTFRLADEVKQMQMGGTLTEAVDFIWHESYDLINKHNAIGAVLNEKYEENRMQILTAGKTMDDELLQAFLIDARAQAYGDMISDLEIKVGNLEKQVQWRQQKMKALDSGANLSFPLLRTILRDIEKEIVTKNVEIRYLEEDLAGLQLMKAKAKAARSPNRIAFEYPENKRSKCCQQPMQFPRTLEKPSFT
ncbi:hypothetical protein EC973_003184 [Apophysomyces ossiformis]|uniref:Uncharacterized protein n=1 Tax=Apophysomyces ossiformis TaxID=679940 RepID=A0A8H7BHD2_9FUNG|nr:hypothetical protein EC973_003184 [Apophysomyces ossiformis]